MELGSEPNWILRRGQYMIVLIFLLAVLLSSFFSFNETIKGKVRITSSIPPAEIIAKQTGKLLAMNYQPGDTVSEGAVLGIIENSAKEKDVEYLKKNIATPTLLESIDSLKIIFPANLRLGNLIQPSYQIFLATYQDLILEKLMQDNVLIQSQLNEEIRRQKRITGNMNQELLLAERAYNLQKKNLERHKELYDKGVISQHDLEKVENDFLSTNQQYEIIIQQIEQSQIVLSNIEKERKLAESFYLKSQNSGEAKLEAAKENLLNSILEWEERYLLASPIRGKLSINNVWGKFQKIKEGEMVFMVVPLNNNNIFGRCKVPVRNSGKILKGQKAYLKLDNYPFGNGGF